ncbi:MAG: hypothetical protein ACRYF2_07195 [Janthinobacterium lividum]
MASTVPQALEQVRVKILHALVPSTLACDDTLTSGNASERYDFAEKLSSGVDMNGSNDPLRAQWIIIEGTI